MSDASTTTATDEPNDTTEPTETTATEATVTHDATAWYDLHAFQRDLLVVAAEAAAADVDPIGLQLKSRLDERYPGEVGHGRLYQNLDVLADEGLIDRREIDGRTNAYEVTPDARDLLDEHLDDLIDSLDWEVA